MCIAPNGLGRNTKPPREGAAQVAAIAKADLFGLEFGLLDLTATV
jgi:hypothetical protein